MRPLSPSVRWRVVCGVLSTAWLIAALVGARFGMEIGSRSPLLWGTVAGAGLTSIGLFVLAWQPDSRWNTFDARCQSLRLQWAAVDPKSATKAVFPLPVAAVLAFAVGGWCQWIADDEISDDDQQAFLETAQEIREQGGIGGLLRDLSTGDFAEANRHPLYLALLSLRPDVPFGRSLSLTFGMLTLGVSWLCAKRLWGHGVAGLLAVLLATNGAFLRHSGLVVCETLLMFWCAAAWFTAIHIASQWTRKFPKQASGSDIESQRDSTVSPISWTGVAGLGALLGLAWLTKATALVLVPVTLAWLLWKLHQAGVPCRRNALAGAVLVTAFVIVGSPLLLRNVQRFGNPVFNVNSSLLFVDEYDDPAAVRGNRSTGELATRYWETHTLGEILWREASGCVWEAYIIVRSLGPAPLDDSRVLFGILFVVVGLAGLLADPIPPRTLLAAWTLVLWVVFAWYVPIAAGERFILPLMIPWLAAAAIGMVRISLAQWGAGGASRRLTRFGVSWCLVWSAAQAVAMRTLLLW